MHLSRLLAMTLVLGAAAVATVVSCSSDSKKAPDIDAPMHAIDAPASIDAPGSGTVSDLGKLCNAANGSGDPTMCTTVDPICVGLTATSHFCTEGCGSAAANSTTGPAGGNAICAMQRPNSGTGTVACALHGGAGSGSAATVVLWACGIGCGTSGSADLGTCPTGMTCNAMSFCQ